jgi:hypothetical protein
MYYHAMKRVLLSILGNVISDESWSYNIAEVAKLMYKIVAGGE